jgi:hypothetical protein
MPLRKVWPGEPRKSGETFEGQQRLRWACRELKVIVDGLGRKEAFLRVQSSWPTLSRELLNRMVKWAEEPDAVELKRLMAAFAGAMTQS